MLSVARKNTVRRLVAALEWFERSVDPIDQLDAARRIREAAQDLEARALEVAREAGATWKDIGDCYGLTKQGAQQRFRRSASDGGMSTSAGGSSKHPRGG